MPEDEFRTELSWPTDPLGERPAAAADAGEPAGEQDSLPPPPKPDDHDDPGDRLLERVDTLRRDVDAHLADVRAELAGIRRSLGELLQRPPETSRGSAAPSVEPLLAELAQVREELVSLRRRISLRADAQAEAAVLSDEQLDRIARTVAGLLSGVTDRPGR